MENNQAKVVFRANETVFVNGCGLSRQYGGGNDIPVKITATELIPLPLRMWQEMLRKKSSR